MVRSQPSLRLRQNAASQYPRKEKRKSVQQQQSPPKKQEAEGSSILYPAGDTAFKALLSARFCAGIWSHISDCDETYNYWEPTHYLVFGKGLQTWEYSPEFALRSYTYLLLHAVPAYIYHQILQPNPLLIFYFIRCLLAMACAFAEVYFYKAVCREFGVHIGRMCFAFQLFAPGFFVASTAFLPSSFAMYSFAAACAAWWRQKYLLAIFFIAIGSLLGWPFAAVLGLPIAYDMIICKKMYLKFAQWTALVGLVILVPMVIIDSIYFGRVTIAPLNIVIYNVLGGPGPDLYGTEPFHFYLINGFLNFNLIWVFALMCPLLLVLCYLFIPAKNKSTLNYSHALSLSPLYIWLLIFSSQAHKEERFLFPVYPMICLCGAVAVDALQKLYFRVLNMMRQMAQGSHYLDYSLYLMIGIIATSSLLGISRIFALYNYYHAPLDLMMELNRIYTEDKVPMDIDVNVCFGKDWHRFPSSFFLPNSNWNVRFIKSEFKGLLPFPYSSEQNATAIIHSYFNNQNQEDSRAYIDISKCQFLLDLNLGRKTVLEPIYAKNLTWWKTVKSMQFLNAEKSNRFFRAFYIPFLNRKYVEYGQFSLLQAHTFTRKT